jgi:hypothetical protein
VTDPRDRAIEAAAREMTAGTPGADLRARIVARIERDGRRRRSGTRWIAPMAAAVLVLLVLAVIVPRRYEMLRRSAVHTVASHAAAPSSTAALASGGAVQATAAAGIGESEQRIDRPAESGRDQQGYGDRYGEERRSAGIRDNSAPRTGRESPSSAVAALAPAPLTVPGIGVAPLDTADPIQLEQMTVPSIDVAPLAIDEPPETRRQ